MTGLSAIPKSGASILLIFWPPSWLASWGITLKIFNKHYGIDQTGQREERPESLFCVRPFIVGCGVCSVPRAADRASGSELGPRPFTKQVGSICTVSTASAADTMPCHQTVPRTTGNCPFISHLLLAPGTRVISFLKDVFSWSLSPLPTAALMLWKAKLINSSALIKTFKGMTSSVLYPCLPDTRGLTPVVFFTSLPIIPWELTPWCPGLPVAAGKALQTSPSYCMW